MWLTAFTIVKKIPWQLWLSGLFLLICFTCYKAGQRNVMERWQASIERGKPIVEELKRKQVIKTTEVVHHYTETIKEIKVKGDTIVQKIPTYIPVDAKLPNGFILLYNSSVSGSPISETSEGTETYSLALRDAAPIIFRNNTACLKSNAGYVALWDWIQEQKNLADIAVKELQQQK